MVTRAESLLIIVGDHRLLTKDRHWNILIEFIAAKGGMVKGGRKLHPRIESGRK